MRTPVNVPVSAAVVRALDALALPGEKREQTIARIVWAFSTAATREQITRDEERKP